MSPLNPLKKTGLTLAVTQAIAMSSAQAATIIVNDFGDVSRPNTCNLRDATISANNDEARNFNGDSTGCVAGDGADIIRFNNISPQTIKLLSAAVLIYRDATIIGNAHAPITIDGSQNRSNPDYINSSTNVLVVQGSTTATLDHVSVQRSRNTGIVIQDSSFLTIRNSNITNNEGVGVKVVDANSRVLIDRSTIALNGDSTLDGGGVHSVGQVNIYNSTISGNTARDGGGVFIGGSLDGSSIRSSTITLNTANDDGGGLFISDTNTFNLNNTVVLQNNIVSGNVANDDGHEIAKLISQGTQIEEVGFNLFGSDATTIGVAFSNFRPNQFMSFNASSNTGTSTAITDILNPILSDNGGATQTHNLVDDSPAINKINFGASQCTTPDQRLESRGDTALGCDLGAVEFLPFGQNIVVTQELSPSTIGCDLQSAIISVNTNQAHDGCIAGGVNDIISFNLLEPNENTVRLAGELPTIISDVSIQGGSDVNTVIDVVNSQFRVLNIVNTSKVDLQNLTLTRGRVTGVRIGGGVFVDGGSDVSLRDSIITGNQSVNSGSGVAISNYSTLRLYDTNIYENQTGGSGAGIAAFNSLLSMNDSIVYNNVAGGNAGGIFLSNTRADINRGQINNNFGTRQGGGLLGTSNSYLTILDTDISRNRSASTGGGIRLDRSVGIVRNSTISENSATSGGGLDLVTNSALRLFDSTVSNNVAYTRGGAAFVGYGANAVIIHSTIVENVNSSQGIGGLFVQNSNTRLALINSILSNQGTDLHSPSVGVASYGGNIFGNSSKTTAQSVNAQFERFRSDFYATSDVNTLSSIEGSPTAASDIFGQLAPNGGLTATHALVSGSPAINLAGQSCFSQFDQRGVRRGNNCDSGAFEFEEQEACFVIKAANGNVINFCL